MIKIWNLKRSFRLSVGALRLQGAHTHLLKSKVKAVFFCRWHHIPDVFRRHITFKRHKVKDRTAGNTLPVHEEYVI